MQILDYKYIAATEFREDHFAIPELDRQAPAVNQFIQLTDLNIELTKPTGFIYVDGFTISQAESNMQGHESDTYKVAVASGTSYVMHKWITSFKNNEYIKAVSITNGSCAGGIQGLSTAQHWLNTGVCEEVILIGGERITQLTLRSFRELKIDVVCGDGFVYLKLAKGYGLEDVRWEYAYSRNPFFFSRDTINTLIPSYPVDFVKLHGTGSKSNNEAEADLETLGIPLSFKKDIGHTQGISSLLEMCIVLSSDVVKGTILVVANGLGGGFGSCTLYK